ncbi:MAG: hypothetical protein JRJ06_06925 [Deltaproteobacteria bacterium]|nr:hypothetical protein [Deltaproteobacteria bacterium]
MRVLPGVPAIQVLAALLSEELGYVVCDVGLCVPAVPGNPHDTIAPHHAASTPASHPVLPQVIGPRPTHILWARRKRHLWRLGREQMTEIGALRHELSCLPVYPEEVGSSGQAHRNPPFPPTSVSAGYRAPRRPRTGMPASTGMGLVLLCPDELVPVIPQVRGN